MAVKRYTELDVDTRLKLLGGLPMEIDNVGYVKPLTLREITKYGYTKYLEMLNVLLIQQEEILKEEYHGKVDVHVFHLLLAFGDEYLLNTLKKAFSLFLREEVKIKKEDLCIIGTSENSNIFITQENYDDLVQVIKWQNGLTTEGNANSLKFKDDGAKELFEKLKKAKELVSKQKEKEGENSSDFDDIVSAVSSKSFSINKFNIFDLTVYQIYDEFKRLDLIDNYTWSLQAMMQGAKNVQVRHWTSKLNH